MGLLSSAAPQELNTQSKHIHIHSNCVHIVQMFSYWKTSKSQNFKTGVAGGGGWKSLSLTWTVHSLHRLLINELTFFGSYTEVYSGRYIVITSLWLWKKGNERFTCSTSVNVASLRARRSALCIFSEGEGGAVQASQRLANHTVTWC